MISIGLVTSILKSKWTWAIVAVIALIFAVRQYGDGQYKRGQQYGKQLGIEETEKTMQKSWAEREQTIKTEETRLNELMENLNQATANMINEYARSSAALDYRIREYAIERGKLPEEIKQIPDANLWRAILDQVDICRN